MEIQLPTQINSENLLIHICQYHHWANTRLLADLEKLGEDDYKKNLPISFGSIHQLLNHLYYYDQKFYSRLVENIEFKRHTAALNRSELFSRIRELSDQWLNWAERLPKLNAAQAEELFSSMLMIYNHNIYHRGQLIATLLMLGYQPASLDIFLFQDEQNASH